MVWNWSWTDDGTEGESKTCYRMANVGWPLMVMAFWPGLDHALLHQPQVKVYFRQVRLAGVQDDVSNPGLKGGLVGRLMMGMTLRNHT